MWKFYFLLSNIIVVIPLLLQVILGTYAVIKKNKKYFYRILIVNIVLQIILCVVSIFIQGYSMVQNRIEQGETPPFNLPPPALGVFIGFACGCVILVFACFQAWRFDVQKRKNSLL